MPNSQAELLYLRQLPLGPMQNFIYLLGEASGREAFVIDPAWDAPAIESALANDGRSLAGILLTHHHSDHLNAVDALLGKYDVPVYLQRDELDYADALKPFLDNVKTVRPGDSVSIGTLDVTCIVTPGHTPGSQCFLAQQHLFTGDTLFVNACGRCDFGHSDPLAMYNSLYHVLGALPDDVRVLPGHHYGDVTVSSMAREKQQNPYFQQPDASAFVAFRSRKR
jgi:hydroxyacylglutathione hydrolase